MTAHVGALSSLETDRLILRPSHVEDAEIFHQLWTERDPRVPPHRRMGPDGRPTVEDVAADIASASSDAAGRRLSTVTRKGVGDVIGCCGLIARGDGSPDGPELAYELRRTAHGRGYATEAGAAVVSWASETGYARLWAGVWDWNAASRRVLSKLGFREVGRVEPHSVHGHSLLTRRRAAHDAGGLPNVRSTAGVGSGQSALPSTASRREKSNSSDPGSQRLQLCDMHLLPYALRRLLHRPKRARRSVPDLVTIHDQREHDLRRFRPRPSAPPPRSADQEVE